MRHKRLGRRLGRSSSHRKALMANMTSALILTERDDDFYEGLFQSDGKTPVKPPAIKGRIVTTLPKAKELRPFVERCITLAKRTIPHQDKAAEFLALLPRYPHLYVDTTMAMTAHATPFTGADPTAVSDADLVGHQDRVLFGSDFPLIPYDYDLERRWAWERALGDDVRRKIFHDNALRFFALD